MYLYAFVTCKNVLQRITMLLEQCMCNRTSYNRFVSTIGHTVVHLHCVWLSRDLRREQVFFHRAGTFTGSLDLEQVAPIQGIFIRK